MKVYFSHGKESGPWGTKIKRLAKIAEQKGCGIESIDYSGMMDPDLRVGRLLQVLTEDPGNIVLVGSSMGGYVSLVASEKVAVRAVFLMAPALHMPGYESHQHHSLSPQIEIVHGWADDVIPTEHSIRYAKQACCTLHLIRGDHSLNSSLEMVAELFDQFLDRVM